MQNERQRQEVRVYVSLIQLLLLGGAEQFPNAKVVTAFLKELV